MTPDEKRAYQILQEIERRKQEEALRYFIPHDKQREWHLCGKRNAWGLGGNRCLPAGQPVYMADGTTMPIEQICVGDDVLAYDINAKNTVTATVIGAGYSGEKPCRKIIFYGGHEIECSDDHPILSMNKGQTKPKWLRADELKEGRRNVAVIPQRITYEQGWNLLCEKLCKLIGYLIGDGSFVGDTVRFTNTNPIIVEDFKSCVPEGYHVRQHTSEDFYISIPNGVKGGNGLILLLKDFGLWRKRAFEKHIPEIMFVQPEINRVALIQGLFSTDGWVDNSGYGYSTTSQVLAKDLKRLLLTLGVHASITCKKRIMPQRDEYSVRVREKTSIDLMPDIPGKGRPRRENPNMAGAVNKRRTQWFENVRVIEETGIKPVYDITIDHPDHAFIVDGIVVHNTGKTVGGATKAVIYSLNESAEKYIADWPEDMRQAYRALITRFNGKVDGWVVSLSNEVQRDVAQKEILKWLPASEIAEVTVRYGRKDDITNAIIDTITLKNGNMIGFKSCEQGRAKFQGTSKHWIWFDEEPPKEIYDECIMRVMDTKGDIFGTMTPLLGLSFVYDDIYLNATKPIEKQDPEIFCVNWDWDDNPWLNDEEKKRLESMLDPNELEARKYGRFIMPGKSVFSHEAVQNGLKKCYAGERGNLEWTNEAHVAVRWEPDETGIYEIWFHPHQDYEYLLSSDVAEGLEHGDYSVAAVINRHMMRLDAVYHGHIDADLLAEVIYKLEIYYNDIPILGVERNKDGAVTISHLKALSQNIYRTMVYDKMADEERETLGWVTTKKTRPMLVGAIKRAVREDILAIYWRRFWDEAMNFIRKADGKEEARNGYWDDAVITMGIGTHIHNTVPMYADLPEPSSSSGTKKKAGWQKDKDGNEVYIHPSILEDKMNEEWGEDGW